MLRGLDHAFRAFKDETYNCTRLFTQSPRIIKGSHTMHLSHAHTQLKEHGTPDNAKHFRMLFTQEGGAHSNESTLSDYVDYVAEETDAWLLGFPESLKSLTAVSKPKTAFLKMLTIPSIMSHLGAQRCFDVADKVSDAYRKLAKRISDERQASAAATTVAIAAVAAVAVPLLSPHPHSLPVPVTPHLAPLTTIAIAASQATVAFRKLETLAVAQEKAGRDFDTTSESVSDEAESRVPESPIAARAQARAKIHAHTRGPMEAPVDSTVNGNKHVARPLKDQFASLIRVVRDLSIMLDDVLTERGQN